MTLQLRPYQTDLLKRTREAMKTHRSVLLQSPTGSGKTALTVYMMRTAAERGMSSVFIVHQNELLKQTSDALWLQRLEHGVIASGRRASKMPALVASVQTLVRRLDQYQQPQLIIIDEAHRAAAKTYRKILDHWPAARVIGLTATPERTDGKGLGDIFQTIVEGPAIPDLIEQGYLCSYRLMAPPSKADLSHVKTSMGDFDKEQAEAAVDTAVITGDAVDHYIEHAKGKRCVVMCISIKHASHVVDQYQARGIAAELIHGELAQAERDAMLQRFKRGETHVLCNVNLMVEGVDIPAIEVIQWLRPTQSLIIWMQGNGRGLRPADGKDSLLILDHVGNWSRPGFGLPDAPRVWSLDGRKARTRAPADGEQFDIRQCSACFRIYRSSSAQCPSCSAAAGTGEGRTIEVIPGKLALIEAEAARKTERIEIARTRDLRDLIELGMRKGMKNPSGWAANLHAARGGKKGADKSDYDMADRVFAEIKNGSAELWGAA